MIDRATVRKMCEHEYRPSLIGSAIPDWAGLSAEERAHRVWGMEEGKKEEPVERKAQ
jgi:hypothetical protein